MQKRIAFVIHGLGAGGAERVVSTLSSLLTESGNLVTIITYNDERFYPIHSAVRHVHLNCSTRSKNTAAKILGQFGAIYKLRGAIKALAPDIVISFGDQNNLMTIVATAGLKVKKIISERINPDFGPLLTITGNSFIRSCISKVRNIIYSFADILVLPTGELLSYFSHPKIEIIENPVATPKLSELSDLRKKRVLSIGRLVPQKRFDLLISAFASASANTPDWELEIVGAGPLDGALRAQVADLALTNIKFCPPTAQISAHYSAASIYVLCSDYEGFPNTLCEAQAHGLATVATRCKTGPQTIIEDGKTGMLVACNNRSELAAAVEKLMRDEKLRRELAQNASAGIQKLAPTIIADKWERLLDGLLAGH